MSRYILAFVFCACVSHGVGRPLDHEGACGEQRADALPRCLDHHRRRRRRVRSGVKGGAKRLRSAQAVINRQGYARAGQSGGREYRRRSCAPRGAAAADEKAQYPATPLTPTTARAGRSDPRSFRHAPCERAIAPGATGETKVRCGGAARCPPGGPRHGPRARLRARHASRAIWAQARAYGAVQAGSDPSDISCLNPSTPKSRLAFKPMLRGKSGCKAVANGFIPGGSARFSTSRLIDGGWRANAAARPCERLRETPIIG